MKYLIIISTLLIGSLTTLGQSLNLDKSSSTMEIQGTSSIHDWESIVEDFQVSADLSGTEITNINFVAIVKSIKSGKSGMDSNTYKALKENEYPEIKFSTQLLEIQGNQIKGNGNLSIAGTTNKIPVALSIKQESKITVTGEIKLKMTDYNITPPTAVFGTIKTGDDIIIQIDFTLIKS